MDKFAFEAQGKLLKIEEEERNVFGIFNMTTLKGQLVLDGQKDVINTAELEKAAYSFVLNSRLAGENHVRIGVGQLIESFVMTKEKARILEKVLKAAGDNAVISPDSEFWFGGFHITDDDVWKNITEGTFQSFSIGGKANRAEVVNA